MAVWKYYIIDTLQWLIANNLLYKSMKMNYYLLDI